MLLFSLYYSFLASYHPLFFISLRWLMNVCVYVWPSVGELYRKPNWKKPKKNTITLKHSCLKNSIEWALNRSLFNTAGQILPTHVLYHRRNSNRVGTCYEESIFKNWVKLLDNHFYDNSYFSHNIMLLFAYLWRLQNSFPRPWSTMCDMCLHACCGPHAWFLLLSAIMVSLYNHFD